MPTSTVSVSNQTAIPSLIRKILGLKPGDRLLWKIDKAEKIVKLKPLPRLWGTYMRGLGKEVWEGIDVEKYIKEGRKDRKIR